MAQQSRAFAALVGDSGSEAHELLNSSSREVDSLLPCTGTHTGKTLLHIK